MLRISLPTAWLDEIQPTLQDLVTDKVASRISQKDFTLWGEPAESESRIRLGWVDAASNSLSLISDLAELKSTFSAAGINRIVLCGMGGSSLAPEVISKKYGVQIEILDSTSPEQLNEVISQGVQHTAVVGSSKSGSTVETDSQKRLFEDLFAKAGISRTERIIIVTDPGSPLDQAARQDGYRVFNADPNVGGRYSALTAFGVVPSYLAGVPVEELLNQALSTKYLAGDSSENPALILGALLAALPGLNGPRDKVGILADQITLPGFADWAEQLIAESTGKDEKGILPIALTEQSPELTANFGDVVLITVSADENFSDAFGALVTGNLAEQFMLWEYATAVASRLIQVNPFDQPDVESAKVAARGMLSNKAVLNSPSLTDSGISATFLGSQIGKDESVKSLLGDLLGKVHDDGYIAVHAYLNRKSDLPAEEIVRLLVKKTNRPVTFGWGPRFLHSTGQYHKGGPRTGVFLQLVAETQDDLAVPTREFSFAELIRSQAEGDGQVLADLGRPVLRLGLSNPKSDFARLIELIEEI